MIPRTLFSSDHELFRDSVRKFLEQEAVPHHHQWEKDGHIDRTLWNKAGEAGMLCSHIPEEYGGMAADFLYSTVVIEEIGRLGLTGIGFSLHSDIVAPYILHYGSEAQKQKYLPKLCSGEHIGALAMSEPNEREAALITFLVTASGMTLAGVGSAFWGIVAGLLTLAVLNWGKR